MIKASVEGITGTVLSSGLVKMVGYKQIFRILENIIILQCLVKIGYG